MMTDTPKAKPPAPFQFSIRSMLLLTAAVAIVCSFGAWMGWFELMLVLIVAGFDLAYLLAYLSMKGRAQRSPLAGVLIRLTMLAVLTALLALGLIMSILLLSTLA